MNPLLVLLGQQAGVPIAEDSLPPVGNTILVEANRGTKYSAEDDPDLGTRLLGNTPAIEATGQAIQRGQEVSDRRGMFGMKGTLRDVLGVLGDAFLMQSGNAPIYTPTRRKEQISDAMAGYTDKPLEAIERVAYYDPTMAAELKKEYETNLLRQAQQQSLEDTRNSQIADRTIRQNDKAALATQGILSTPGAIAPDGSITPAAMQAIGQIAKGYQTTPEALLGGLTGDAARLYARGRIDPYQQERLADYDVGLAQGERRTRTGERNADTAERRAAQGRRGSNPTEASELARIRARVNAGLPLSPGDQATWDERPRGPQSKTKETRRPGGTKPSVSNW